MGRMKILGLPDIITPAVAFAGATSDASASTPAANLLTEEPSEFWRSGQWTELPRMYTAVYVAGQIAFPFSGIGLVGHNLWRETGQIRFIATAEAVVLPLTPPYPYSNVLPNNSAGASNVTGNHLDVDEGITPDANFIVPTVTANPWAIQIHFATPSASPRIGATPGYQAMWVWAKASTESDSATAPQLYLEVLGVGAAILATIRKPITSAAGQWVNIPWDGTSGQVSTGAAIELLMQGTAGAGGGYVSVGSVVWLCESTEITGDTDIKHDSGWLTLGNVTTDPYSTSQYLDTSLESHLSHLYDCGAEVTAAKQIYVFYREDHNPNAGSYAFLSTPTKAPGYIEVGKMMAGLIFSPVHSFAFGEFFGAEDLSTQLQTDGGQEYGSRRQIKRVGRLPLATLTPLEVHFVMDRWVRRRGVLGPVLVSMLPADATETSPTTFYATLRNQQTLMAGTTTRNYSRALALEIEEKL